MPWYMSKTHVTMLFPNYFGNKAQHISPLYPHWPWWRFSAHMRRTPGRASSSRPQPTQSFRWALTSGSQPVPEWGFKVYCYLPQAFKNSSAEKLKIRIFLLRHIHSCFKINFHLVTNLTSLKEKETNGFGVGKWCFV